MDENWIEHRRSDDGERLGWMKPLDGGFVVIDVLGRRRSETVDWMVAEETLDRIGLSYLADPYELRLEDGSWLRVRIAEVSPDVIRLTKDDWGDTRDTQRHYSRRLPITEEQLRPLTR